MSRINRLTVAGFAIGLALTAGAGALVAHADNHTPDPVETPHVDVSITAIAMSNCGGIGVGWTAPDTADVKIFRANVTPDPDGAEPAPEWVLVDVEPVRVIDYPTPHGDTYLYRLDVDTDRDEPGPEISIMSDRVTSYACTTTTPTPDPEPTATPDPGPTPSPSPSPSSSADPSPSAPVSPSDGATPSQDSPGPEREGGLANTGVCTGV